VSTLTAAVRQRPVLSTVGALILVVIIYFAVIAAQSKPAIDQISPSPLVYHKAPALSGESLYSNSTISLRQFRGHFVLVNYFASWCSSCASEEKQIAALARSSTVQVLGVDYDDTPAAARRFLSIYHAHFPVLQDPNGGDSLRWGVSAPPESFLVAPNGTVLAKVVGPTTVRIVDALVTLAQEKGY
jgi:cytochrome c biogenesis protein CcmG/thiol:disulfide interchange protein DsbE